MEVPSKTNRLITILYSWIPSKQIKLLIITTQLRPSSLGWRLLINCLIHVKYRLVLAIQITGVLNLWILNQLSILSFNCYHIYKSNNHIIFYVCHIITYSKINFTQIMIADWKWISWIWNCYFSTNLKRLEIGAQDSPRTSK